MEDTQELETQVVDLIRRDAVNVPPYPAVAMRLQRLASSDDFGMSDLHRVISGDPVLAATVLRYANSAAFRGINPTSTLETAVSRIGTSEVCKIALATSIGAHAIVTGCLSSLRRRYWRLSMTSAMLCRTLAVARKQNPEEAFICGLLHDFGQVIATACFEEVLAKGRDTRVLPEAVWADCVDRFHVELGLVTAARWNLPPLICSIISSHHNPKTDPSHKDLLDLILVCDAIALHLDHTPSPTVETIATIPNLLPDEPARLINGIPTIAAAVASLDETTPGKTTGFFQLRNHIEAPRTSLSGPNKPFKLKLQVIKSNGNLTYETLYMAKDGLGFTGQGKLRENSMVRLRLEIPNSPIEIWAVILPCYSEGSPMRMEAKLFAADPSLLNVWTNYYTSLE